MRKAGGVIALLGGLLVATSSFAGWEDATGSLGTSSSPSRTGSLAQNLSFRPSTTVTTESIDAFGPYLPLLLVVIVLLGYTAYVSLRGDATVPARAWQAAAAAAAASLVFGVVFIVAMLATGPSDWWLDTGFFAGLAAGAIAAVLLRRERPEMMGTRAPD